MIQVLQQSHMTFHIGQILPGEILHLLPFRIIICHFPQIDPLLDDITGITDRINIVRLDASPVVGILVLLQYQRILDCYKETFLVKIACNTKMIDACGFNEDPNLIAGLQLLDPAAQLFQLFPVVHDINWSIQNLAGLCHDADGGLAFGNVGTDTNAHRYFSFPARMRML